MGIKKLDLSGGTGGRGEFSVNNQVPIMTSNNAPSGVCSASTTSGTYYPWCAFDQNMSSTSAITRWMSTASTGWLQYQFAIAKTISIYRIHVYTASYAPKTWTLKGSNNGTDWSTLDTQTNITGWTTAAKQYYVSSPGSYTYYRLDVTVSNGSYVEVSELELFDAAPQLGYKAPNNVVVMPSVGPSIATNLYWMDYLFNNTIPSQAGQTTQYWLSAGANGAVQTLIFDFNALASHSVKYIRLAPKSDTNYAASYRILSSTNNSDYVEEVPFTNNGAGPAFGTIQAHSVDIAERYIKIEITPTSASYPASLAEVEIYLDDGNNSNEYFVSQQHGNDSNDGFTPATAWATINKAVNTVCGNLSGNAYIYVGSGTYRERVTPIYNGFAADKQIIYAGDPSSIKVTVDNPGKVIISSYQANEIDQIAGTATNLIDVSNKSYIEFRDLILISNATYAVNGNGAGTTFNPNVICRNIKSFSGYYSFYGVACYNCYSLSRGGGYFYSYTYNCIAVGSQTGFGASRSYNCLAICCPGSGFSNGAAGQYAYNCIAHLCRTGLTASVAYSMNCFASHCGIGLSGTFQNSTHVQCDATATGPMALFDYDFSVFMRNAFADQGTNTAIGVLPALDLNGLARVQGNGTIDAGVLEAPDYQMEYTDVYQNAPAIRINQAGEIKFTFKVNANQFIIKRVFIKHHGTDPNLKPQLRVRGLGLDNVVTAHVDADTWEELVISARPNFDGTLDFILCTRDTAPGAYTIFSDPM